MKIEEVIQRDLKDCGACCISCIIKYYGGYVPVEKIREDTVTTINGTTAFHLISALKKYGFESMGVKVTDINDKNIYFPAIAHVVLKNGLQHFVVIYKITNKHIYLMDPAKGKVKMKKEDFLSIWDNVLILAMPISEIIKFEKETTIFDIFFKLLHQNKKLFLSICLVNFLVIILAIFNSFYFQIAVSQIEQGSDLNFLKFIIILFGSLTFLKVIFNFFKVYYLNYFNKNIDLELFTSFLKHIFNLPLKFMQNRTTGEIISRVEELSEIKSLLSEIFTNFILNLILVMTSGIVLYFINAQLFFLLCLVIGIYIVGSLIFNKIIYRHIKENIDKATEFNAILIENVELNNSIKNLNLEEKFLIRLESKLISFLKSNFNLTKLLNKINLFKDFIYEVGLFLILTFGIYLIAKNKLALLNLITFNSIILYLFDPIKDLIELLPKYNYLKASFKKLGEFLNIPEETHNRGFNIKDNSISLKNVTFSYNQYKDVIKNITFDILPNEKVFLHGKSGSGKSTICKLLYRIYEGYSGSIFIGGHNELDCSLDSLRNNICYVGQEEQLFTGSIKENILCYRDIPDSELDKVSKICHIDEIINKRANRYETIINAASNNLSGGERQRIILARALLKKGHIMILDEALSEVNETLEREILNNIIHLFPNITLIYVSHKNLSDLFPKVIEVAEYE